MTGSDSKERWTVSADQEGRLDVFLTERLQDTTRSSIRKWIDGGHVLVNSQVRKAGHALRSGDQIEVCRPAPPPIHLQPQDLPLRILYEDAHVVVVDKPSGMVVHPGAGNREGTLANALLHHLQTVSREETPRPGIVHRLDKDTSGLMVVAKNEAAHLDLSQQFKDRSVIKRYLALVYGRVATGEGSIEIPIGRDPRQRTRISVRSRHPRSAKTSYQVVQRFESLTLLRIQLHTGRTHQIRVHLEHIGHPVVGDLVYRAHRPSLSNSTSSASFSKSLAPVRGLKRQFLHAAQLSFRHPETKRVMNFESELPPELASLLSRLE